MLEGQQVLPATCRPDRPRQGGLSLFDCLSTRALAVADHEFPDALWVFVVPITDSDVLLDDNDAAVPSVPRGYTAGCLSLKDLRRSFWVSSLLLLGFVFGIPILVDDRHHPHRGRRRADRPGCHGPRHRGPENLLLTHLPNAVRLLRPKAQGSCGWGINDPVG